jgi:putative DNA primase/helicase
VNNINVEAIPAELKQLRQWICWRYEKDEKGKLTKVPYQLNGRSKASTTNPKTWSTFDDAFRASPQFSGIGFVFNSDYTGVDLDHAINGSIKNWAAELISKFPTYAEFSPSGEGVHLISQGAAVYEGEKGRKKPYGDGGIEIYSRERFFTFTGNRLESSPEVCTDQTTAIRALYQALGNSNGASSHSHKTEIFRDDISERLEVARKDLVFSRLWDGDTSANNGDDSAADGHAKSRAAGRNEPITNLARKKNDDEQPWPKGVSDFNDLAQLRRSQLGRWLTWGLERNGNGLPLPILKNAALVFKHDPALKDVVFFDQFHQRLMTGTPAREWADVDDIKLVLYFQDSIGLSKISREVVSQAVILCAHQNARNCVRDWLEGLTWDKEPRIDHFFEDHFGAAGTDYTRAASRNFWLSLVARVFRPGCQVDTMVVLEGGQGIGKSRALRIIGGPWFTEQHESVTNQKAFSEVLQGKLIVEIGEMDSFSRAEVTRVKQIISAPHDRFRKAYGRHAEDHPRQCVFVGTTNRDDWNRDETGARRFWPIRCNGEIDTSAIQEHREQFFAEAVELFKLGKYWWEMPAEATRTEQEKRYVEPAWVPPIKQYIAYKRVIEGDTGQWKWIERHEPLQEVTIADLLEHALDLPKGQWVKANEMRVAECLRFLGWQKKDASRKGKTVKIWLAGGDGGDGGN